MRALVVVEGQTDNTKRCYADAERKSGNIRLRRDLLGWDEATYERIKEQLIQQGRIQPGGGRGGSVQLLDDT